jgi:hypothetical protein
MSLLEISLHYLMTSFERSSIAVRHDDPLREVFLHGLAILSGLKRSETEADDVMKCLSKGWDEVVNPVRLAHFFHLWRHVSRISVHPCHNMLRYGVPDSGVKPGLAVSAPSIDKHLAEKLGSVGISDRKVKEGLLIVTIGTADPVCRVVWAEFNGPAVHVQRVQLIARVDSSSPRLP